MRRLVFSLWAALLCVVPSAVAAQQRELRAGTRIRFSLGTSDTLHVADVTRLSGDSVFVDRCLTCSRSSYSRAELNQLAMFRPYHPGRRMVTGFGVGGLAGLALGVVVATKCGGGYRCEDSALAVPFLGLAGGLIGGLAGYLTGYRWVPIGR